MTNSAPDVSVAASKQGGDAAVVERGGHVAGIQILRGLAALAVVVFHAREEVDMVGRSTRLPPFTAGAFGVDLFFVISGFVMVLSSSRLFGTWRSIPLFLTKRVIRIVPLYWSVTLLFAVYLSHGPLSELGRGKLRLFLAKSLAFVSYVRPLDGSVYPAYPLGWTLNYEMFFYACFALVLGLARPYAVSALVLAFACLCVLNKTMALPGWLDYLSSTQILEFVAGVLLAQAFGAGVRLPGSLQILLVAASLAVVGLTAGTIATWGLWRGCVWGAPAAMIVAAVTLGPPWSTRGEAAKAWLERLGDASYALYLVHYGLYVAIEALLARLVDPGHMPASAFMALLVSGAIVASLAVHRSFEAPLTRALQRLLLPGRNDPSVR